MSFHTEIRIVIHILIVVVFHNKLNNGHRVLIYNLIIMYVFLANLEEIKVSECKQMSDGAKTVHKHANALNNENWTKENDEHQTNWVHVDRSVCIISHYIAGLGIDSGAVSMSIHMEGDAEEVLVYLKQIDKLHKNYVDDAKCSDWFVAQINQISFYFVLMSFVFV